MPISNFPFKKPSHYSSEKPFVPIRLINPQNEFTFNTWALIDTGADTTAIPEHIAKQLGHRIRDKKVKTAINSGIGGDVTAYLHTFSIEILDSNLLGKVNDNKSVISIPSKEYPVIYDLSTTILGEDDFLKDYILTIDYPNKRFSIKQ